MSIGVAEKYDRIADGFAFVAMPDGVSRRRFTAFWYTSDLAFPAVTGPDFPLWS